MSLGPQSLLKNTEEARKNFLRVKISPLLPQEHPQALCCSAETPEGRDRNSTCLAVLFWGFKPGSLWSKGQRYVLFSSFFIFLLPPPFSPGGAPSLTHTCLCLRECRILRPSPPPKFQGEHTAHENFMPYVTKQNEYLIGAFM